MANNLTKYDAFQVLRSVFDVSKNTLRVSIVDGGGGGGGGLEVVISHTDDSIRLGNGTDFFTSTYIGPKVGLDVGVINEVDIRDLAFATDKVDVSGSSVSVSSSALPTGAATAAKQDTGNTSLAAIANSLSSIDGKITSPLEVTATDLDIRNLTFATDKTDVSGSTVDIGNIPLPADAATETKQDVGNTSLASIDSKLNTLGQKPMAGSVPVVLASDQPNLTVNANVDLNGFTSTPDSVQIVGSENGLSTGTKYGIVNNQRQQILASHDRQQDITYADFGTKNQRITQIEYTSSTFPGISAVKTISYTLVGNNYRRDSIVWTIV